VRKYLVVTLVCSPTGDATSTTSSSRIFLRRGRTPKVKVDSGHSHGDRSRGTGATADPRREVPPRPRSSPARRQAGRRTPVDVNPRGLDRRR